MENIAFDKLANPVWTALEESQSKYVRDYGNFRFFDPDYTPFGACNTTHSFNEAAWADYAEVCPQFFIVGHEAQVPDSYTLEANLVCNQMVLRELKNQVIKDSIVALRAKDEPALIELIELVMPGYFKTKTARLGQYFGIFRDNKLVAACGQRMELNAFQEVSGVVTHPAYTRLGFAKQLVYYTTKDILVHRKKTPFLHVLEDNAGAIHLYEQVGFETIRKMSFRRYSSTI